MSKRAKQDDLILTHSNPIRQNLGLPGKPFPAYIGENEKWVNELIIANGRLIAENEKYIADLVIANKELVLQNQQKKKVAARESDALTELIFQKEEKGKRAAELVIANKELVFQNEEKQKRAIDLSIANKKLGLQNLERKKHTAELDVAYKELVFQKKEKDERAAELNIACKELAFQNEEKAKRAIELASANNELASFYYSVSHDLRAPLRAITSFTQILMDEHLHQFEEGAKSLFYRIIANSERMADMLETLLKLSRIEQQFTSIEKRPVKEVVDDVLLGFRKNNQVGKITITVNSLDIIHGDRNMLTQVFHNLISNAMKFTQKKDHAVIEIGSYLNNGFCVCYVKDNGAGFDMNYYYKLFGVFQRLHSNNEFQGTGVGLAIVHKIITKLNGSVWAEGKVNEGACFYISLPVL